MLSVMGGQPHTTTCSHNSSAYVKHKLREYLRFGSCDGRVERKALRKELAALMGVEYDEKESRIK